MRFLAEWMPVAPPMDEEGLNFKEGVSVKQEVIIKEEVNITDDFNIREVQVKEEIDEDVGEDNWMEIKEESIDYGDEGNNEVREANIKYENPMCNGVKVLRGDGEGECATSIGEYNGALSTVPFLTEKVSLSDSDHSYKERGREGIFSCEVCDKSFPCRKKFMIHKRIHTRTKTHSCDVCGKLFGLKGKLLMHTRVIQRRSLLLVRYVTKHSVGVTV
ncbi:zinc finger protein 1 homolog [Penaeus chinensis]|uniref:zinc finger protein 1 homolog n=1 Tax=Penaeus chinensis TaxID=139456 RepID=UPI001FB80D2A|nr:zinc finger protein 1 homolog [Penaeus chinensis]